MSAPHFQWFSWGFRVWLGFGVAGLLSGMISFVRAERLRGLTLAGLILNTILVCYFVAWFIGEMVPETPPSPVVPAKE
jgi:hypothetical protein